MGFMWGGVRYVTKYNIRNYQLPIYYDEIMRSGVMEDPYLRGWKEWIQWISSRFMQL